MSIQRFGVGPRMSKAVAHGSLVFLAGQVAVEAKGQSVTEQTKDILGQIDAILKDAGTEFVLAGDPEVGLAQIRYRPSVWTGSDDAWLEDVFVLEEARGKGIGRLLTEAAVRQAGRRGCGRIQLESNQANGAAISLYETLGFRASHLPDRWGEDPDLCLTLEIDPTD